MTEMNNFPKEKKDLVKLVQLIHNEKEIYLFEQFETQDHSSILLHYLK